MNTIWKHTLRVNDSQTVLMPRGAQILCAREQHGDACLWFMCASSAPKVRRRIMMLATGHPVPDQYGVYIDTVHLDECSAVFHVFDGGEL